MKYAFVFISIIAIWVAMILLAAETSLDGTFLAVVAIIMTLALFYIGFRKKQR